MDVERKSVDAAVSPVEDSKSKHGEFDVILSTSDLDRDGDELYADEWKTPLPDKITFDSDHGMSVATCVGSGRPFINDNGQLQVRGTFASTPHGQAVRTLVNEGHIDRVSVAFRNLPKTSKDAKPQRELLNGAFVCVPANDKARVLASKSANWRDDTMQAIAAMFDNSDGPDQKYWQGVHDVAVKLGGLGCASYADPQTRPDVLQSSNRSVGPDVATKATTEPCNCTCEGCTCPSSKSSPQPTEKSASTDAPQDAAVAGTDDTEKSVALLGGKSLALRLGSLDF